MSMLKWLNTYRRALYDWQWQGAVRSAPVARRSPGELRTLTPAHVRDVDDDHEVAWLPMSGVPGHDSFFDGTIERAWKACGRRRPVVTPFADLQDTIRAYPNSPPAGFIFHVSRCGSTALSNMLAALPQHLVLSEPQPINAVLQSPLPARDRRLAAVTLALGNRRPWAARAFVKLSSWNLLYIDEFLRAFPGVPCVFMYREPVEVLVSNLRRAAGLLSASSSRERLALSQADESGVVPATIEEQVAAMIGSLCATALGTVSVSRLLVNYTELADPSLPARLGALFGFTPDDNDLESMRTSLQWSAKTRYGKREHVDDSERKREQAGTSARAAVERFSRPHYERLEAARLGQASRPARAGV